MRTKLNIVTFTVFFLYLWCSTPQCYMLGVSNRMKHIASSGRRHMNCENALKKQRSSQFTIVSNIPNEFDQAVLFHRTRPIVCTQKCNDANKESRTLTLFLFTLVIPKSSGEQMPIALPASKIIQAFDFFYFPSGLKRKCQDIKL